MSEEADLDIVLDEEDEDDDACPCLTCNWDCDGWDAQFCCTLCRWYTDDPPCDECDPWDI